MILNISLVGYRSFIAAGLTGLFSVLATVDWNNFLNDPKNVAIALIPSIVMAIMRLYTKTPPFQSEHPAEVELKKLQEEKQ